MAYIDRNGNGDLTEPSERVELDVEATNNINLGDSSVYNAMHVFPLGKIRGTNLRCQLWVRNPDFDASNDDTYRKRLQEFDEKKWVNGTLMRIAQDGSHSQNPLLMTARPDDAQISRFDGPVTADLKWDKRQKLEPWPKQTVFDIHLGYRNLLARNCDHQAFSFTRMTTTEVPKSVQPAARFEFPAGSDGAQPAIKELQLDQRCCGGHILCEFNAPAERLPRNSPG